MLLCQFALSLIKNYFSFMDILKMSPTSYKRNLIKRLKSSLCIINDNSLYKKAAKKASKLKPF